jgi:ketosteroid isomerase-like protein
MRKLTCRLVRDLLAVIDTRDADESGVGLSCDTVTFLTERGVQTIGFHSTSGVLSSDVPRQRQLVAHSDVACGTGVHAAITVQSARLDAQREAVKCQRARLLRLPGPVVVRA